MARISQGDVEDTLWIYYDKNVVMKVTKSGIVGKNTDFAENNKAILKLLKHDQFCAQSSV